MIKRIITLFFLHTTLTSFAQEPAYTPMNLNYKFKGIRVDSLFLIPSFADTATANTQRCATIGGSLIRTGNDFWMRNAAANAWLQNVNVGNGANPVVSFVDSIYRKVGKDSIFFRKNNIEYKIKDSTGGGGTDSPDRINGLATGKITANMNNDSLKFTNGIYTFSGTNFKINTTAFYINNLPNCTGPCDTILNINEFGQVFKIAKPIEKTDSPDRINGTATGNVTANLNNYTFKITNADTFKIDSKTWINKNKLNVGGNSKDSILVADTNGIIRKMPISAGSPVGLQTVLTYDRSLSSTNNFQGNNSGWSGNYNIGLTHYDVLADTPNLNDKNIVIGYYAGSQASGTDNNIFIGKSAGVNNSGDQTIAIGKDAGNGNSGGVSVLIGNDAGSGNQHSSTVAVGTNAAKNNKGETTAIGFRAAEGNDVGNLTAVGYLAGYGNKGSMVAIGSNGNEAINIGDNVIQIGSALSPDSNLFDRVILLGDSAKATDNGQLVLPKSSSGLVPIIKFNDIIDSNRNYNLPNTSGDFVVNNYGEIKLDTVNKIDYTLTNTGVYSILTNPQGNKIELPDCTKVGGQMLVIYNGSADSLEIVGTCTPSCTGLPYDFSINNVIYSFEENRVYTLFSDGRIWMVANKR